MTTCTRNSTQTVQTDSLEVEVLSNADSERYLGKKACINDFHQVELDIRISAVWSAFSKFKPALCSSKLGFGAKMKLFEAVVTPVALYGCASWTLTSAMGTALKTVWRRMLRMMLGMRRATDEDWIEYAQRATHVAEDLASKAGKKDWALQQKLQKWKVAGEVARSTANRWSTRLLQWRPMFRCTPRRKVGHPCARWDDCIVKAVGGNWPELAKDFPLWSQMSDGYCELF